MKSSTEIHQKVFLMWQSCHRIQEFVARKLMMEKPIHQLAKKNDDKEVELTFDYVGDNHDQKCTIDSETFVFTKNTWIDNT